MPFGRLGDRLPAFYHWTKMTIIIIIIIISFTALLFALDRDSCLPYSGIVQ